MYFSVFWLFQTRALSGPVNLFCPEVEMAKDYLIDCLHSKVLFNSLNYLLKERI